jgi:hypothetical protein
MKTIAALLLTMIFGIQLVVAQDKPVEQKITKFYSWNESTHDFGKIKQNDPAAVTFTVKNDGKGPLIITAAKTSCGCTIAEYTKEPIKPGESGIVKATYNSARVGSFTKTVTVTYDGIADPDILTIKGEVLANPETVKPTEPAKPVEPVKPAEPAKK